MDEKHMTWEATAAMYLARNHYSAEKDALARPFLKGDLKVRLGSVDVDERNEDSGDGDLCAGEDIVGKVDE